MMGLLVRYVSGINVVIVYSEVAPFYDKEHRTYHDKNSNFFTVREEM